MTDRRSPALGCLIALAVSALVWGMAWCSLPGPQPVAATPTVIPVVVQPTVYQFVSPTVPPPSPSPELILTTPTHAPSSTLIPTQTPAPTILPTVAPSRSPIQRG